MRELDEECRGRAGAGELMAADAAAAAGAAAAADASALFERNKEARPYPMQYAAPAHMLLISAAWHGCAVVVAADAA